jgi:hypothetical protein
MIMKVVDDEIQEKLKQALGKFDSIDASAFKRAGYDTLIADGEAHLCVTMDDYPIDGFAQVKYTRTESHGAKQSDLTLVKDYGSLIKPSFVVSNDSHFGYQFGPILRILEPSSVAELADLAEFAELNTMGAKPRGK